jgi:hypothetical protein
MKRVRMDFGLRVLPLAAAALLMAAGGFGQSAVSPGPKGLTEHERLYTPTDPTASGGIKGTVVKPARPIEQILAMPPDEPRFVYKGMVIGDNRQSFLFGNLPMAKYNLFVIYEDEFYEGLQLSAEPDTLTASDRQSITKIVNESDPFFNKKIVHRIEGTTGRGNFARCIVTQYRDGPGTVTAVYEQLSADMGRRTFKLIWLKQVGPGWQVVQKRDLYPVTVSRRLLTPKQHYNSQLSNIRVTGRVKDLGEIDLSKAK